ncbi:MAG: FAD-dependent oxidoreductase [Pseudomonadota bacterium]
MGAIVVVGAGQAASSLAVKLRALGHEGPLTIVGEEPVPPYQRPPLSKKYLLGEMEEARLYLRPREFYAEQGIALRLGVAATGIDRPARVVHLADGSTLPYDQLALTTGSIPLLLPVAMGGALAGVYTVRTLADVDAMAPEFAPGRRVLVVGGGYIGLEAAAVAAMRGLAVTLVEAAPRILQRVAAVETADFMRALHESHGVEVVEGASLTALPGDSRVTAAELSDGRRIDVDFVVVGIGIRPATDLAEAAGLTIDNGIAVDAQGRTSDPLIFAAGDCTSFPYGGGRVRLESVPNAIDQGEAVAAAMIGDAAPYQARPWFWSDQFDMKLQIAGLGTGFDRTIVRPGARPGTQSVWYFEGPRLLAVDALGDARAYMLGKRWIEAGRSPPVEGLADPTSDLKTLL